VEGRNIAVEYRWAEGNYQRLPDLAKELGLALIGLPLAIGVGGVLLGLIGAWIRKTKYKAK